MCNAFEETAPQILLKTTSVCFANSLHDQAIETEEIILKEQRERVLLGHWLKEQGEKWVIKCNKEKLMPELGGLVLVFAGPVHHSYELKACTRMRESGYSSIIE